MKKIHIFLAAALLFTFFLIASCFDYSGDTGVNNGGYSSGNNNSGSPSDVDGGYESSPSTGGDVGFSGSEPGGSDGGNKKPNSPNAGQLTAGVWSDIINYDFYLNLFKIDDGPKIEESQRRTSFIDFVNYFGFETRYMVTINVVNNDLPVNDAVVELHDADDLLFTAKTDARGNAYLFPYYDLSGEEITVKVKSGSYEKSLSFVYNALEKLQITMNDRGEHQSVLDMMFVIDTTGSMGDELNYLKAEIAYVINSISMNNPNYIINLALLFYRDIGDDYVTRYFDFTTDITLQQTNLSRQSASGGGDFPEAADRALKEAVEKNWTSSNATRLIFHVCDAPPHNKQENATVFFNAVKAAAQKGIRIIPIASSGIDLSTEFLLRQEALMTGGTYIFLTDDSGIGNSHLEPTIGEYVVEYLNACMIRVVNEYLTGEETEPVPYNR